MLFCLLQSVSATYHIFYENVGHGPISQSFDTSDHYF